MDIIWLSATAILVHRLANRLFGRPPWVVSVMIFLSGWCCGMLAHATASLIQLSLQQFMNLAARPAAATWDTCASILGVTAGVLLARHRARFKSDKAGGAPKHA